MLQVLEKLLAAEKRVGMKVVGLTAGLRRKRVSRVIQGVAEAKAAQVVGMACVGAEGGRVHQQDSREYGCLSLIQLHGPTLCVAMHWERRCPGQSWGWLLQEPHRCLAVLGVGQRHEHHTWRIQ